ncbi:MAG: CDP-alcohol phosphatidyltransferase family protein [Myxococcota bacterium]
MSRYLLNPANWMTAASVACGVLACVTVVGWQPVPAPRIGLAAGLIICAALLDAADGSVARMLDLRSGFGRQLDTLADVLSFGLAPAVVAYAAALGSLGSPGVAVAVGFVLAVAFRLARFHDPPGPWPWPARSRGLPSTMAGGATAGLLLGRSVLVFPDGLVAVMMAGLAILMVSSLPFPTFKDLAHHRGSLAHFGGIVVLAVATGVRFGLAWFFAAGAAAYLVSGFVDAVATALRHR